MTAEKLVRPGPADGSGRGEVALRGVALGELTLATMAAAPVIRVDGDVRRLEIAPAPRGIVFRIERDGGKGQFLRGEGGVLVPLGGPDRASKPLAVLTARGALPAGPITVRGPCPVIVREAVASDGTRSLELTAPGHRPRKLGAHFGAGLAGLPIP